MTSINLYEAYASVYKENFDEDLAEELDIIENFVEEIVFELIDEGYDIEEIEEYFDDELIEEILDEAEVTYGSGSRMAAASRLSRMKGAQKIARQKARKEKVQATVTAVKDTAKAKVAKAKEAGREAKFQAVDKKVAAYANNRKLDNAPGLKVRSKDPEKRRGLRAKVAGDIVSRAKGKLDRGVKKATDTAGKAVTAVKNAPERAGSAARRGLKGLIRRGAEKVARGAGRLATRMGEEVETYDVVVEFLCDYGIAEDLQEAQWLMVNEIDSEDIESILEAYGLDEAQQIMSVSKGGKQIYKAPRSEPSNEPSPHKKRRMQQLKRAQKNADRRGGDSSPARNRAFDRWVSGTDTPFNRTRTSNIKKLNAPTEPNRSNSDDPYRTVQTDYSARRRRASGS
jgi:hypothetical protein